MAADDIQAVDSMANHYIAHADLLPQRLMIVQAWVTSMWSGIVADAFNSISDVGKPRHANGVYLKACINSVQ
jgi:hypothetical protein